MRARLSVGLLLPVVTALGVIAGVGAQPPQPPEPAHAYFLVQFDGPIREEWKTTLRQSGAEILEYVPDFGYKVRAVRSAAGRFRGLPGVRSVAPFDRERKIARRVQRAGSRPYIVVIAPGADPSSVSAAIAATGAQIARRDGARLMVIADAARLDAVAALPDVAAIDELPIYRKHNEYGAGAIAGASQAHAAGFDGSTQIIAIADTGLGDGTLGGAHSAIPSTRLLSIFNLPGAPSLCFQTILDDGARDVDTGHGTHVANTAVGSGAADGAGRGTAPGAHLVFQAVENYAQVSFFCSILLGLTDGYYLTGIPADLTGLFQQAYDAGARIHSNSWGSEASGAYTVASADADEFTWTRRDMVIAVSAGNSGTDANLDGVVDGGSITSPATAKNVIAVGASENDRQGRYECDPGLAYSTCAAQGGQNSVFTYGAGFPGRFDANPLRDDPSAGHVGQMAAFSSRGPTTDGRIKPDVVAPGTWILSGYSNEFQQHYDADPNPTTGRYQYDGWGFPRDVGYKYLGGTSMSTPIVAGGAAIVRDFYLQARGHNASAALVKATLVNSAIDLPDENNDGVDDNAYPIPNMHEGWGRIDLVGATSLACQFVDEGDALVTGGQVAYRVAAGGAPLKITLVWTDFPATTSASRALVNDLDLRVVGPTGEAFTGNVFAGGWSVSGGSPDRLNNVENVYVAAPTAGDWTVAINGFNVPMGPQPFALVVAGATGPITPIAPPPLPPSVSVLASVPTASEAGLVSGAFTIERTGATDDPLAVSYSVTGTATPGSDYIALPGQITIPAGAASALVPVVPIDDPLSEPDETVIVTIVADSGYTLGESASASVRIVSDDAPADLVISAVTAPSPIAAGSVVTVTDTTRNQGAGLADGSVTAFYLSTNSILDAADVRLGQRTVPALSGGSSSSGTTDVVIPAETPGGLYFILARADDETAIAEVSENNNLRSSAGVRIGPDLLVSALTGPEIAASGGTISVGDTTINSGPDGAPASATTFYFSASSILGANDEPAGQRQVPALSAGASHSGTATVAVPSGLAVGRYFIIAKADGADEVMEGTEGNNTRTRTVNVGPDLTAPSVTAPAAGGAGRTLAVSATISNLGLDPSGPTTAKLFLSTNASLSATDIPLGEHPVPALAGAASATVDFPATVPADTPVGSYYVLVQLDPSDRVAEFLETNNVGRSAIVRIGPDLRLAVLTAPANATGGTSIAVTDTTDNIGGGDAAASETQFYLSTNTVFDAADLLIGSRIVPALEPGASSTATTFLELPVPASSRIYYLIVVTDGPGSVSEISETNNRRVVGIYVIAP